MHPTQQDAEHDWRKGGLIALLVPLSLYLAYLLVANVALWTGAVERAVAGQRDHSTLEMSYDRAWTLWPTQVHVREFLLRIDGYTYQLELNVPNAEIDITLWELLEGRFVAQSIDAEGVSAILNLKKPEGKRSPRRLRAFTPIGTFGAPIQAAQKPERPDRDDAWEVHLDDVVADLAALTVNEISFEGQGHLYGGLDWVAGYEFGIPGLELGFDGAQLKVGGRHAGRVTVEFDATLDPQRSAGEPNEDNPPNRPLHGRLDLDARLDADVDDLEFVGLYIPSDTPLVVEGGRGSARAQVGIRQGVLVAGSRLEYRSSDLAAEYRTVRPSTGVALSAVVDERGVSVDARLREFTVSAAPDGSQSERSRPAMTARHIELGWTTTQTDLTAPKWPVSRMHLEIPQLVVREPSVLTAAISRDRGSIAATSGRVELQWRTTLARPQLLDHRGQITLVDLVGRGNGIAVRASGKLNAHGQTNLSSSETNVSALRGRLEEVSILSKNGRTEGSWIEIDSGKLSWNRKKGAFEAALRGRVDDLGPVIEHARKGDDLLTKVPDFGIAEPVEYAVELATLGRSGFEIDVEYAKRSTFGIHGLWRKLGDRSRGAFHVDPAQLVISGGSAGGYDLTLAVDEREFERVVKWVSALKAG